MPEDAPAAAPAVLVVEDEALIALLVEHFLTGAGYRDVWSRDGAGAAATAPFSWLAGGCGRCQPAPTGSSRASPSGNPLAATTAG
jgi:hypothetical protein